MKIAVFNTNCGPSRLIKTKLNANVCWAIFLTTHTHVNRTFLNIHMLFVGEMCFTFHFELSMLCLIRSFYKTWRAQMLDCKSIPALCIYLLRWDRRFRVSRDADYILTCRQPVKVWRSNLFAVRTSRSSNDDFPFRWRSRRSLWIRGTPSNHQVVAKRSTWSEKATEDTLDLIRAASANATARIRFEIAIEKWAGDRECRFNYDFLVVAVRPRRNSICNDEMHRCTSQGSAAANAVPQSAALCKRRCCGQRNVPLDCTQIDFGCLWTVIFCVGSMCYSALLHVYVDTNAVLLWMVWA